MRSVLLALVALTLGATLALTFSHPEPLAQRVKHAGQSAVLARKQAMVDCMAYTAAKMVGTERGDRETDEACESLAEDFVSTLPHKSEDAPPSVVPADPEDAHAGELSL